MFQPLPGDKRIGQIRFAQQLQAWFAGAQLGQHRVGAAVRQPGIDDFDYQIHLWQYFPDLTGGLVHVAGKPVDAHTAAIQFRGAQS